MTIAEATLPKGFCAIVSWPAQENTMAFDLTRSLKAHRRQRLAGAIKTAAKLIADCPDPELQWKALRELRLLQQRLGNPSL
jgi:hypothetical protein